MYILHNVWCCKRRHVCLAELQAYMVLLYMFWGVCVRIRTPSHACCACSCWPMVLHARGNPAVSTGQFPPSPGERERGGADRHVSDAVCKGLRRPRLLPAAGCGRLVCVCVCVCFMCLHAAVVCVHARCVHRSPHTHTHTHTHT